MENFSKTEFIYLLYFSTLSLVCFLAVPDVTLLPYNRLIEIYQLALKTR